MSFEERGFRHESGKALNACARATGGDAFQQFANEKEEHDHSRFFAGPDCDGAHGRNRHQGLNRKGGAGTRRHIGTPRNRREADQHRRDEGPRADGRRQLADRTMSPQFQ